jgi:hypothetical protein
MHPKTDCAVFDSVRERIHSAPGDNANTEKLEVMKVLVFGYCDKCVRNKDWCCRKREAQAT